MTGTEDSAFAGFGVSGFLFLGLLAFAGLTGFLAWLAVWWTRRPPADEDRIIDIAKTSAGTPRDRD